VRVYLACGVNVCVGICVCDCVFCMFVCVDVLCDFGLCFVRVWGLYLCYVCVCIRGACVCV